MRTLPLFDEPISEIRKTLREKLGRLAQQNLFVGTSSWKYEGWIDQIYTRERYFSKGRFSRTRFESECLAEYAETFPIVCGDFSFYQFPSAEFWRKLFEGSPSTLQFALKIPAEVTVRTFPRHPRYGPKAGSINPNFLNTAVLKSEFFDLLEPYRDRIAVLIFEFGAFQKAVFAEVNELLNAISPLIAQLPQLFRYAVEIRNPDFLTADYFEFLRDSNIAHVFNSWTKMPPIAEQTVSARAFTADFTVARALLRPGRKYEQAVELFTPYQTVQEPNHEVREALRNLLLRSKRRAEPSFIFVNNRLEGNAPQTIEAVLADW